MTDEKNQNQEKLKLSVNALQVKVVALTKAATGGRESTETAPPIESKDEKRPTRDRLRKRLGDAETILAWAGGSAAGILAAANNATAERDRLRARNEKLEAVLDAAREHSRWCHMSGEYSKLFGAIAAAKEEK